VNEFKISNHVSKQRQIKNVIEKKRLQRKKSIFEVEEKEKIRKLFTKFNSKLKKVFEETKFPFKQLNFFDSS